MAVKTTTGYIDLLNKAVEREIAVSLQYILQHAKMEKLVRRQSLKTSFWTKPPMTPFGNS